MSVVYPLSTPALVPPTSHIAFDFSCSTDRQLTRYLNHPDIALLQIFGASVIERSRTIWLATYCTDTKLPLTVIESSIAIAASHMPSTMITTIPSLLNATRSWSLDLQAVSDGWMSPASRMNWLKSSIGSALDSSMRIRQNGTV